MALKTLFPTFVYYERLMNNRGASFRRELLTECRQIRAYDKAGQKWSAKNYPGGYTSYSSIPQVFKMSSTFDELRKKIDRHVVKFAEALDYDLIGRKLEMTDCWINVMPKQVVHPGHIHPLSTISGTYYVSAPKGCSSIRFEDPRSALFMAQPPRRENCRETNKTFVGIEPEEGKVILFESWLRHEVEVNQSKDERISVSFNYNWF